MLRVERTGAGAARSAAAGGRCHGAPCAHADRTVPGHVSRWSAAIGSAGLRGIDRDASGMRRRERRCAIIARLRDSLQSILPEAEAGRYDAPRHAVEGYEGRDVGWAPPTRSVDGWWALPHPTRMSDDQFPKRLRLLRASEFERVFAARNSAADHVDRAVWRRERARSSAARVDRLAASRWRRRAQSVEAVAARGVSADATRVAGRSTWCVSRGPKRRRRSRQLMETFRRWQCASNAKSSKPAAALRQGQLSVNRACPANLASARRRC